MNKDDRSFMSRIEGKLDTVVERGIRTEEKLDGHLSNHTRNFKIWTVLTGILLTLITLIINVAADHWR